jgi:microcystin-dependent protein
MLHSGAKTAGGFYGGTTAPSNTTRANYDGYLYATRFYGDGSQLTGITATSYSGVLAAANGGTGQSSYAVGDLLYASTTTALSKLADVATGNSLISGGVGVAPSWGKIGLTTHVSGTLAIANGGTGATTAAAARTGLGATTLGSNLFTITNPSAITFPRFNADNTVSALSAADFRTAIGAGTGTGTVTSIATGNGITGGTITTTGTLGLTGQALALHNLATNGIIARTGSGTVSARTISASGNGISVSNGDGVSGNPTVSLSIGTGATQVAAGNHTHSDVGAPVGSIMIWAGSTAPTGWLLCDGTAYSTTTYAALYAVIGTTYGSGTGTFRVPNLKGRVPVGLDAAQTEFDTRGETGGEKTHTLVTAELPAHNHDVGTLTTASGGSHTHSYTAPNDSPTGSKVSPDGCASCVPITPRTTSGTIASSGAHTHTMSGSTASAGSGTAMNVLQPYIVMYYIIKY